MVSCCACAAAEAGSWRASAAAVTWAYQWIWLWCLVWSEIHLSTRGGKYMYTWIHALQYSWHGGRRVTYWLVIIMQLSECNMHNLLKVAIIEYTHTYFKTHIYRWRTCNFHVYCTSSRALNWRKYLDCWQEDRQAPAQILQYPLRSHESMTTAPLVPEVVVCVPFCKQVHVRSAYLAMVVQVLPCL